VFILRLLLSGRPSGTNDDYLLNMVTVGGDEYDPEAVEIAEEECHRRQIGPQEMRVLRRTAVTPPPVNLHRDAAAAGGVRVPT